MRKHIPWLVVALTLLLVLCVVRHQRRQASDAKPDLRDSLLDEGRPIKHRRPPRWRRPIRAEV